jgi:predicted aldo/keto reductase-like oxidoreductase
MPRMLTRRSFLAGTAALAACDAVAPLPKDPPTTTSAATRGEVPTNDLGKTGVTISRVGVGGAHLGRPTEAEAIRIVRTAIDRGVTFMDNSWDYNGGESERRMGKALGDGWRRRAFLMTKIDGRDRRSAAAQLEQSLRRLRTDVIDLVQIHEVIRTSDARESFAPGGCVEALVAAREAGKVRFIGFTGHKDPSIHLEMLRAADAHGFSFDAIMFPLNVMDAHFRSFEHGVLPAARARGLGVCSMKPMGGGDVLRSGVVTAVECLRYALHLPTDVVITGCDSMSVLDQAIHAATSFPPLSNEEVDELLGRTRDAAMTGRYELFKTSGKFDSTAHHPQWLHGASI